MDGYDEDGSIGVYGHRGICDGIGDSVTVSAMLLQVRAAWQASTTWSKLTNPSLMSALCKPLIF